MEKPKLYILQNPDTLGTINGRKKISDCCNDFNLSYKNFRWQYAQ